MATMIITTYDAFLSRYYAAREFIKSSRGVDVKCRLQAATPTDGGIGKFVVLEAFNKNFRPVIIVEAGLRLSNNLYLRQTGSDFWRKPLPMNLDPGKRVEINFDLDELKKLMIVQLPTVSLNHGFVRDAEGKEYTTRLPKSLIHQFPLRHT